MIFNFFRNIPHKLTNNLSKMNQNNSDFAFNDQYNLIEKIGKLNKQLIILDIGANEGKISQKYGELFSNLCVYAFEPFPESYTKLKEISKAKSYIKPYNIAISNFNGNQTLYCNVYNETNSLFPSNLISPEIDCLTKSVNSIKVETITIDEFFYTKKLDSIDILKMDIQGSELLALEGAVQCLKQDKIAIIYTEVEFISMYKNQPLFLDIANYLNSQNYVIYGLYNFNYINNQLAWCDAIFINKNIFNKEVLF